MTQPWWHKDRYTDRRNNLVLRAKVLTTVRQFFNDRGFIEVDTPALQVSPGLDRHVRPLGTSLMGPFEPRSQHYYLHTSPEFSMKKLLAAGEENIFQLCHVFRDGEDSKTHHPEFTMLEWYRAGQEYNALTQDVEDLLSTISADLNVAEFVHGEGVCGTGAEWEHLTVAEAFARFADIDILGTVDDDVRPTSQGLLKEANRINVRSGPDASWDDLFHLILLEKVEPALKRLPRVFLKDYPTPLGALARRKPNNPAVCERVEAFVCGLELANGFSELTDPAEQRDRFDRDRAHYAELYGEPPPIDEELLAALGGMPPAAGMAMGLDRLVMLLAGADHIRDVLWAPVNMPNQEPQ